MKLGASPTLPVCRMRSGSRCSTGCSWSKLITVAWPEEHRLNLMALLLKPDSTRRIVAKACHFYSLRCICRKVVIQAWECTTMTDWDMCRAGLCVMAVGLIRAVDVESFLVLGEEVVASFLDRAELFDHSGPWPPGYGGGCLCFGWCDVQPGQKHMHLASKRFIYIFGSTPYRPCPLSCLAS